MLPSCASAPFKCVKDVVVITGPVHERIDTDAFVSTVFSITALPDSVILAQPRFELIHEKLQIERLELL